MFNEILHDTTPPTNQTALLAQPNHTPPPQPLSEVPPPKNFTPKPQITSAKQLVGKLHKRVIQNKMLMYCIAAALAIMIIVLVVVSF